MHPHRRIFRNAANSPEQAPAAAPAHGPLRHPRKRATPTLSLAALLTLGTAYAQEAAPPRYDYPTTARADYVIGCLAANNFRRELLPKCACAIDEIANQLPYADYEKANTILSMQQGSGLGRFNTLFRDTPIAKEEPEKLHRAQAEANLRCGE